MPSYLYFPILCVVCLLQLHLQKLYYTIQRVTASAFSIQCILLLFASSFALMPEPQLQLNKSFTFILTSFHYYLDEILLHTLTPLKFTLFISIFRQRIVVIQKIYKYFHILLHTRTNSRFSHIVNQSVQCSQFHWMEVLANIIILFVYQTD